MILYGAQNRKFHGVEASFGGLKDEAQCRSENKRYALN